jgi:hypothetical protein
MHAKKFLSDSKEKKKLEILENLDNPIFFIEVLDELELFVAKRVIFDEKKISVGLHSGQNR